MTITDFAAVTNFSGNDHDKNSIMSGMSQNEAFVKASLKSRPGSHGAHGRWTLTYKLHLRPKIQSDKVLHPVTTKAECLGGVLPTTASNCQMLSLAHRQIRGRRKC